MNINGTTKASNSTISFARELFSDYETFRFRDITSRRFTQADMLRWIHALESAGHFSISPFGTSAEGRPIPLLTLGKGSTTVLLWSQMHGDEPTATMALMDILNFLSQAPQHPAAQAVNHALKILIVPMLNPDGAERFQRRTAQEIDMNRDALSLETPEAKLLKTAREHYRPRFGFNLHDQDPRYTVGTSKKVSAIALLAPAFDNDRSDNHIRLAAKQVAAVFALVMEEFIPGHVSKYDDAFEPRAFGDNIQRWGTSTVLVESGGWPDDRDKMFIRKLNAVGLLATLFSIASDTYSQIPMGAYEELPFGTKFLYDIILWGARLQPSAKAVPVSVDIGINIDERKNPTTGAIELIGTVMDIGDLRVYGAFREIHMNGTMLPNDVIQIDKELTMAEVERLLPGV